MTSHQEEPALLPADFVIQELPTRCRKGPIVPGFINDDDDSETEFPSHIRTAGWREIMGALPGETQADTVKRLTEAKARAEMIQAGIDGGFYDREDSEYVNIVRGSK
jgi:hypothetical protein